MVFLVGVVGLSLVPFCDGDGAVNEADNGLLCNGTVVPGALPFDRGFGEGDEFEMAFVFVPLDDEDVGGGRRGDLGGEG